MQKAIINFVGLYVAIVIFVYGIFPLGIASFISARMLYGSWSDAAIFYSMHMGMAASSILGLIPIYGNKLHYVLSQSNLLPWAVSHGVGTSWLVSLSGSLAGVLGAMCPGALLFPIFKNVTGDVPGVVLVLGGAIMVIGTIYSVILFF